MRWARAIAAAIAIVLFLLAGASQASAFTSREIKGVLRTGDPSFVSASAPSALCAWHRSGGKTQGMSGWVVPLHKHEGGGTWVLREGGAAVAVDPSVYVVFVRAPRPCLGVRQLTPSYDEVPHGATHAVVMMRTTLVPGICYFPCAAVDLAVNQRFRLFVYTR